MESFVKAHFCEILSSLEVDLCQSHCGEDVRDDDGLRYRKGSD